MCCTYVLHVLYVLYVCSSPVDCAVLISAQDDVLQSIDTAIQRIYDEAAANNGMMNEQQRKMLAYVVYCVCFVVRVQCTAVYVQYATVYMCIYNNVHTYVLCTAMYVHQSICMVYNMVLTSVPYATMYIRMYITLYTLHTYVHKYICKVRTYTTIYMYYALYRVYKGDHLTYGDQTFLFKRIRTQYIIFSV